MSFDYFYYYWRIICYRVSIPFDQGDVFRQGKFIYIYEEDVSIPFDQGDVFRQDKDITLSDVVESQSLSIRAMSFDQK